jgi:hypothetical protein
LNTQANIRNADLNSARRVLLSIPLNGSVINMAGFARKEAIMLQTCALYASEITEEERNLGFELVSLRNPESRSRNTEDIIRAVAYRLGETDQIVKMNVPVVGGYSYRHERLGRNGSGNHTDADWIPVGSVVFPTATQAVQSLDNPRVRR